MQISMQSNGNAAQLSLAGSFEFQTHREFREAYDAALADPAIESLEINLARVNYIDSSALGMLLVLRDRAKAVSKNIVLTGLHGSVEQVLEVANFGKLFSIRR
jgi:anti-anti-sigma factor